MKEQGLALGMAIGTDERFYIVVAIGNTEQERLANSILIRPIASLRVSVRLIAAALFGLFFRK